MYMYIYVHQQIYTHTCTKVRKREIITRDASTGFKELLDLWRKWEESANGNNLVDWIVSFGDEKVLQ